MMALLFGLFGQALCYSVYRVIPCAIPSHFCPIKNGSYALSDTTCSFWLCEPDFRECIEHLRRIDLVNRSITKNRENVVLQCAYPLCSVFFVFPGGRVLFMHFVSGFLKTWNYGSCLSSFREWVATASCNSTYFGCCVSCLCQRDQRNTTQPKYRGVFPGQESARSTVWPPERSTTR